MIAYLRIFILIAIALLRCRDIFLYKIALHLLPRNHCETRLLFWYV